MAESADEIKGDCEVIDGVGETIVAAGPGIVGATTAGGALIIGDSDVVGQLEQAGVIGILYTTIRGTRHVYVTGTCFSIVCGT